MVLKSKEFPSQTENRRQWILDVVREHQGSVEVILSLLRNDDMESAKFILGKMHKSDRDALLQPNGILTDEQIELLK